jgi:hypothetical protein
MIVGFACRLARSTNPIDRRTLGQRNLITKYFSDIAPTLLIEFGALKAEQLKSEREEALLPKLEVETSKNTGNLLKNEIYEGHLFEYENINSHFELEK